MRILKVVLLAACFNLPATSFALDVSFGNGAFFNPPQFLETVRASADFAAIERALHAVVLIGGRASGVIISADGLMVTARHTVADLSFTNADCSRIPLFLNHEIAEDGSVDTGLRRLVCDHILINEYSDDFILLQLKVPAGQSLPFAQAERDVAAITVGMRGFAVGYPHALNYSRGVKKVSVGPIVLYRPEDAELPHFLHLIDTEGGSSGGAILSERGKLVGLHFRGVRNYGPGVETTIDGKTTVLHRFNVALPLPYLMKKYLPQ